MTAAAIALFFIVSSLVALFGLAQAGNTALQAYVFDVEECRYDFSAPRPPDNDTRPVIDAADSSAGEECLIDDNRVKREIIDGAIMFIIFGAVALFLFFSSVQPTLRKLKNE